MHLEVEKLDYKLDCLVSVYNAVDSAVTELEFVQLHAPLFDTSDILSSLRERRVLLSSLIFKTREELFNAYCKYHGEI